MLVALLFLLASAWTVSSTVSVIYSLENQLPLIARIGQPYSWSFNPASFSESGSAPVTYSVSDLPEWLSFDNSTLTFHGTPAAQDEGTPSITVTANDQDSSADSTFSICVTPFPPPTLQYPIESQFYSNNPALSSVFLLASDSALQTGNPTLRIPPNWSFSIGLQGNTFSSENALYYAALQSDATPLPDWIIFDPDTITFDGVAPHEATIVTPYTLSISLHASDQQGYTADTAPFDVVIAEHELSAIASLPTINVTAETSFNVSLLSPADYSGILVDGQPIQPENVTGLFIDVSSYEAWLQYNEESTTLTGQPPQTLAASAGKPLLPVTLTSNFNQSIETNLSLAVVPSYFSSADVGDIVADPGQTVHFNLVQYFSNATGVSGKHNDANLSAAFDPSQTNSYLHFDPNTAQLTGLIPKNSTTSQTTVTFTAYSEITHSTSHTSLSILFSSVERKGSKHGLGTMSPGARRRLILALSITFGLIGGVLLLGLVFALFRRCARMQDSALQGEEGSRTWTAEERKWYGIGPEVNDGGGRGATDYGYGWTRDVDTSADSEKGSLEAARTQADSVARTTQPHNTGNGALGLGLRRVSPRSPTGQGNGARIGVMSKGDFIGKIKETARNVSDKYKRTIIGSRRPIIGNPVAIVPKSQQPTIVEGLPFEGQALNLSRTDIGSGSTPFDDPSKTYRTSTIASFTTSPSSSTGERSIPRRRADFAPPRSPRGPREPLPAHLKTNTAYRHSVASNASTRTHATDPVAHSVERQLSMRSAISAGGLSTQANNTDAGEENARLVPFTHTSRVPPPHSSSSHLKASSTSNQPVNRVASQTAHVFREEHAKQGSLDDLRIGMHYVRTLGGESGGASTNVHSASDKSFSSLESSHHGHGNVGGTNEDHTSRILVRAGERFKFRIPVKPLSGEFLKLEAKLTSGQPLPAFLQLELKVYGASGKQKRTIEFFGIPAEKDIGELHVGVYATENGECAARVIVQVVGRS